MPHTKPDGSKSAEKEDPQNNKTHACTLPRPILHIRMTLANVLSFDLVRILAALTRRKNTGKGTEGRAGHGHCPSVEASRPSGTPSRGEAGLGYATRST